MLLDQIPVCGCVCVTRILNDSWVADTTTYCLIGLPIAMVTHNFCFESGTLAPGSPVHPAGGHICVYTCSVCNGLFLLHSCSLACTELCELQAYGQRQTPETRWKHLRHCATRHLNRP